MKSWYTIERANGARTGGKFSIECDQCDHVVDYVNEASIGAGYYESVPDVVRAINESIAKLPPVTYIVTTRHGEKRVTAAQMSTLNSSPEGPITHRGPIHIYPVLKYSQVNKKVSFLMMRGQTIRFAPSLGDILGLSLHQNPYTENDEDNSHWKATYVADIARGIYSVYVYADILEHQLVGDSTVPLLRIVDASGEHGATISRIYENPRYIPVQKKHFDSVEIDLRSDTGAPVQFEYGKVVVTLHFRKAAAEYFA